ncbi:MAG TPA: M56 family metallopeptidase [Bryobacteraceae bacterium]|nr:M56 family metallopeptidase [Bryobacteraceae bacterium]
MQELFNHLWQSTAFGAVAGAACLLLRNNRARLRYWLWLAASVKFLLPFSLLVAWGDRLGRPLESPPFRAVTVERLDVALSPAPLVAIPALPVPEWQGRQAAASLWALGSAFLALRWMMQWLRLRRIAQEGTRLSLDMPVPVLVTKSRMEPGLFGILRPVLLLPQGLPERLTPAQLRTILAHELCHLRAHDNLGAGLHLLTQTVFWFHPLVWWIGRRLLAERERACDESVAAEGNSADDYVAGILGVCRFCLQTPAPCAAGVTGSDLTTRVREIMTQRVVLPLTAPRKAMLTVAACCLCFFPLLLGVLRGQTLPPPPKYGYEAVTIRPTPPGETMVHLGPGPQGGLRVRNNSILLLLRFAYNLQEFQLANVPAWVKTERYDLVMTPDTPETALSPTMSASEVDSTLNRHRQRMQAVLRDRLGLVLRAETKEQPIYALVIAKGGPKLKPAAAPERGPNHNMGRGRVTATSAPLDRLVFTLSQSLGRHVADETGLTGVYDFTLQWTPDAGPNAGGPAAAEDSGPSLFAALQEQLGLKLESRKGPVPVLVIEKIQRPSEN